MEHIIQLSVSVDDQTIERKATEYASKMVAEEVMKAVHRNYYNGQVDKNDKTPLKTMIEDAITNMLTEYKDFVLERAAVLLAEKLSRSKAAKERTEKVVNGLNVD